MGQAFKRIKQWAGRIPLALRYGLILGAGLIILKTLEYQLFSYRFSIELYTGLLALFFLLVGTAVGLGWLNKNKPDETQNGPNPETFTVKELSLLKGLTEGLTNQQLAQQQFVSVNTIKTHLQKLYRKLEVNNRHQAVAKAKTLNLLD